MREPSFARLECRMLATLAAAMLCASSACAFTIAGNYTGAAILGALANASGMTVIFR